MVRLTDTLWESEPEVAVTVICDVVGVPDAGVVGIDGDAVAMCPLLQPVIAPTASMQSTSRSAPRTLLSLLRIPAKPRSPSGSRLASAGCP